jgi:transcriptional regulator with XRE-family HTH domain
MDHRTDLGGFLASRRAKLTPEQAGVPLFAGSRRVPGLRREEVAHLAGISVDYYTRLERGKVAGVSEEVLDAIARALQLNDTEREHLWSLARSVRRPSRGSRQHRRGQTEAVSARQIRPQLQFVLDAITVPAFIENGRLDIVAANPIGWAVHPHAREARPGPFNQLKFQLLDPRAPDFYLDWEQSTTNAVALLRAAVGRAPDDPGLIQLVGELSNHSDRFRKLWAAHDVLRFRYGAKRYRHPVVGEVSFDYQSFDVSGEPDLVMLVYSIEPGSPAAEAIQLLANWGDTTPSPQTTVAASPGSESGGVS